MSIYLKLTLTLLGTLLFLGFLMIAWIPDNVNNPIKYLFNKKKCFEIKIIYYTTSDDGEFLYKVSFTNDNWASENELLELTDYTENLGYVSVYSGEFCGSKEESKKFAENFTTYEQCIKHNEYVKKEHLRLEKLYQEKGYKTWEVYSKEENPIKEMPLEKEIVIKSCK